MLKSQGTFNKNDNPIIWNGYEIMQNEKFTRLYCKQKHFEILKIDKTIAYFHKVPVFGYTFMKIHSPDLEAISEIIQKAQRICEEKNVAILEIITPYKNNYLHKYMVGSGGTLIMNLSNTEDDLWKNLKKSTRDEVRQAERKGVQIECARNENDFNDWWFIHANTASAKKFRTEPHNLVYELFKNSDLSRLFVAKVDNKIIAGSFILLDKVPLYWLGATDLSYSKYRPNNLLQWEIIKWAKEQKYPHYDMGGAIIDEEHGPTKFKKGFSGEYKQYYIYRIPNGFIKSKIMKIILRLYR